MTVAQCASACRSINRLTPLGISYSFSIFDNSSRAHVKQMTDNAKSLQHFDPKTASSFVSFVSLSRLRSPFASTVCHIHCSRIRPGGLEGGNKNDFTIFVSAQLFAPETGADEINKPQRGSVPSRI
jgi:hypothetical protein